MLRGCVCCAHGRPLAHVKGVLCCSVQLFDESGLRLGFLVGAWWGLQQWPAPVFVVEVTP